MQFIWEHRRALTTQGKRSEFDEDQAFEKELEENRKRYLNVVSSPEVQRLREDLQIREVFDKFRWNIRKLEHQIYEFNIVFSSDDFIKRYTQLDSEKRKELEGFMSDQHRRLEDCTRKTAMFLKFDDKLNGK